MTFTKIKIEEDFKATSVYTTQTDVNKRCETADFDESAVISLSSTYGLPLSVTFVRPSSETTIHD